MTQAFDSKDSRKQEMRHPDEKVARPKDASTLIIMRHDEDATRILMGQRHSNHTFMPDKYVFPGGRVDRADSRIRYGTDLRPAVEKHLLSHVRGNPSPTRARTWALAAIRETFEETGLLLGRPTNRKVLGQSFKSRHEGWQHYLSQGVEPDLSCLDFIARAITPPYRARRFDTRFFLTTAETIVNDSSDMSGASGELVGLRWFTLDEALTLDLPNITRIVLGEVATRLSLTPAQRARHPVPFIFFRKPGPMRINL
ncbi:MAG: NUDIX hydrolase [Parvularculales bacterium]